jgi:hypothetical protein
VGFSFRFRSGDDSPADSAMESGIDLCDAGLLRDTLFEGVSTGSGTSMSSGVGSISGIDLCDAAFLRDILLGGVSCGSGISLSSRVGSIGSSSDSLSKLLSYVESSLSEGARRVLGKLWGLDFSIAGDDFPTGLLKIVVLTAKRDEERGVASEFIDSERALLLWGEPRRDERGTFPACSLGNRESSSTLLFGDGRFWEMIREKVCGDSLIRGPDEFGKLDLGALRGVDRPNSARPDPEAEESLKDCPLRWRPLGGTGTEVGVFDGTILGIAGLEMLTFSLAFLGVSLLS